MVYDNTLFPKRPCLTSFRPTSPLVFRLSSNVSHPFVISSVFRLSSNVSPLRLPVYRLAVHPSMRPLEESKLTPTIVMGNPQLWNFS